MIGRFGPLVKVAVVPRKGNNLGSLAWCHAFDLDM